MEKGNNYIVAFFTSVSYKFLKNRIVLGGFKQDRFLKERNEITKEKYNIKKYFELHIKPEIE